MDTYDREKGESFDDTDKLNNYFTNNQDKININVFHMNIRSIQSNFDELTVLLQSFKFNCDIIVLSESWGVNDINDFSIYGYNIFYNEARYNQNDGLIVYTRNGITPIFENFTYTQVTFTNIKFKFNNNTYSILAMYRPPASDKTGFLNDLGTVLNAIDNYHYQIYILLGDINLDLLTPTDPYVSRYINELSGRGFKSLINRPTRVKNETKTCLDHIFFKQQQIVSNNTIYPVVFESAVTDHFSSLLKIQYYANKIDDKNTITKKYVNFTRINECIQTNNWAELYQQTNVNEAFLLFSATLGDVIKKCTEYQPVQSKNRKIKPWITLGLIKSISTRDKLKKRLLRNQENIQLQIEYKTYRNYLTKLIAKTKQDYYKKQINNANNNSKKIWQIIRKSINKSKNNNNNHIELSENDEIINDPQKVANKFNHYFSSIGMTMAKAVQEEDGAADPSTYENGGSNQPNSLFLTPVNKKEIDEHINSLKTNSACGLDGISVSFIKTFKAHLLDPLMFLINLAYQKGVFPTILKESVITPIHKSGNQHELNNYRPISVTSQIAKIFEKTLKKRLWNFINQHNIISTKQFGFREKTSTEDAIFHVTDKIYSALNNKLKTIAIFLDLAKAFDTVSHNILIHKLEKCGIRGLALDLFKSYLSDRIQVTKINNIFSAQELVTCGIPQGTVLGPILFLIYINSLLWCDTGGEIVSYADDTVLIFTGDCWEDVANKAEEGLYKVKCWLGKNLLTLNKEKTKYIAFSPNITGQPQFNSLIFHINCNRTNCRCSTYIHQTSEIKYLGIIIDSHLRWDKHIIYTYNRLKKLIHKFYQLRSILSKKVLIITYKALVESVLQYGIIAWGGTYTTTLNILHIVQKHIIKVMLFKNKFYSTSLLFPEARLLDVGGLYIVKVLKFYYLNPKLQIKVTHTHDTRAQKSESLNIPNTKNTLNQKSIKYIGPKLFNSIPVEFKRINNYNLFSKKITAYVLENSDQLKNTLIIIN